MGTVEIRDDAVWFAHIDDDRINSIISNLNPEEVIYLVIDGQLGFWARMQQGDNNDPTPGLKPVGEKTRSWWRAQQDRRGTQVGICLATAKDIGKCQASA